MWDPLVAGCPTVRTVARCLISSDTTFTCVSRQASRRSRALSTVQGYSPSMTRPVYLSGVRSYASPKDIASNYTWRSIIDHLLYLSLDSRNCPVELFEKVNDYYHRTVSEDAPCGICQVFVCGDDQALECDICRLL